MKSGQQVHRRDGLSLHPAGSYTGWRVKVKGDCEETPAKSVLRPQRTTSVQDTWLPRSARFGVEPRAGRQSCLGSKSQKLDVGNTICLGNSYGDTSIDQLIPFTDFVARFRRRWKLRSIKCPSNCSPSCKVCHSVGPSNPNACTSTFQFGNREANGARGPGLHKGLSEEVAWAKARGSIHGGMGDVYSRPGGRKHNTV